MGCEALLNIFQEAYPTVHAFGYIHKGYGIQGGGKDSTVFVNGASANAYYEPINPPLILALEPEGSFLFTFSFLLFSKLASRLVC